MPRPVLVCFAGIALLSVMDAVIKEALKTLPVFQVAFLRYAVGSACMTAIVATIRPGWPRADTVRANAVRALLVVVTATCFFYGIGVLPLAEALLLSFMSPFFTAVLAATLLGEKLGARTFGAIAAGFAGVAVIVAGSHGGGDDAARTAAPVLGAAAVLLSALTYSASNVLLRARAQRDPLLHIVLIQNVAPGLILAVPAALVWVAPSGRETLLLLGVGMLGVAGHLCLARAYAGAEASRLAPLDYTALIWALGLGFFAFGEIPTLGAAAGATLIFLGVLIGARKV